jgi:PAS domain-containing protein
MVDLRELFKENIFFKTLFDTIPVMILVVDSERTVRALNEAAKTTLGQEGTTVLRKVGEVFNCINYKIDSNGCGHAPNCKKCIVRNTAKAAVDGNSISRAKGQVAVIGENEEVVSISLLVSSAPMEYEGQKLAITVIEDVSNITELQGLLPICCSCKKIRDDQGYWNQVEKFIQKHSEAEFTHSYCPECIEKLFPQFADKVNSDK